MQILLYYNNIHDDQSHWASRTWQRVGPIRIHKHPKKNQIQCNVAVGGTKRNPISARSSIIMSQPNNNVNTLCSSYDNNLDYEQIKLAVRIIKKFCNIWLILPQTSNLNLKPHHQQQLFFTHMSFSLFTLHFPSCVI